MKLELKQDLALGRLTLTMTDNCHGDSRPLIDSVQFNRFHEKISPDTAALAGAMIASRWCGEVLEFSGFRIGGDVADAVRLIAADTKFVQPIDGYRRNLCEGHLDLLVSPAATAGSVLDWAPSGRGLTRLVTWSGEFVAPSTRSSAGHLTGEVSTNADILLPPWETSVCLGLLIGGLRLDSIVVPRQGRKFARDVERIARALRIIGVHLRTAGPAPREHSFTENPSTRARVEESEPERPRLHEDRLVAILLPALTVEKNPHGSR